MMIFICQTVLCINNLLNNYPPPDTVIHPYLFYTSKDIPDLKQSTSTTHREHFEMLVKWADQFRFFNPIPPSSLPKNIDTMQVYCENGAAYIFNMSLLYILTEKSYYLDAAKKWLLAFGSYPADIKGNFCVGAYALAVAAGYDMLYNDLSDGERKHLSSHLAAIVRRGIQGTRTDWWAGIAINHDHWLPVTGLGIGSAALFYENPEAHNWLTFLLGMVKNDMTIAGDDGAWAEGTADWIYAMSMTYFFFDAYKRISGEDLFQTPMAKNAIPYRLYNWLTGNTYIYHHDSFVNGRYNVMGAVSGHLLFKLARENKDGHAQWLAMQEKEFDLEHLKENRAVKNDWHISKSSLVPALHSAGWNFLWYDPTILPVPPDDLPKHHYFPNQGLVIMRTGWTNDDIVCAFTCSPVGGHKAREAVLAGNKRLLSNYGHTHAQANSFDIFAYGRYLAVPPSYGRLESSSHNTLTINGAVQERRPQNEAHIVKADLKDEYCYVVGDATRCYPDSAGIKKWYRHIAFIKPDVIIIADEIITDKSYPLPTRWHLNYLPEAVAVIDSSKQEINIFNGSRLNARILHPSGIKFESKRLGWSARQVNAVIGENNSGRTDNNIVAVLSALKDSLSTPPESRLIKSEKVLGAVVDGEGQSKAAVLCMKSSKDDEQIPLTFELSAKNNLSCQIFSLKPGTAYNIKITTGRSGKKMILYKFFVEKGSQYITNEEGTLLLNLQKGK